MGHLMASPFVRACTPLAKSEEMRDWQVIQNTNIFLLTKMFDDHTRSKMVTVHVGRFSKVLIGELTCTLY